MKYQVIDSGYISDKKANAIFAASDKQKAIVAALAQKEIELCYCIHGLRVIK